MFFGRLDYYSVKRMPTFWRKKWVNWTIENLEMIYGGKGSSSSANSETREMSDMEGKQYRDKSMGPE